LINPKRLVRAGREFLPNNIRADSGSYLYWNVEASGLKGLSLIGPVDAPVSRACCTVARFENGGEAALYPRYAGRAGSATRSGRVWL
jgi:hypothetical protein